ncbi:MAG TPA: hypothetical protein VKE70_33575, partial [Candidatus Solibacter sp.]|nr:hypothetical protein [Candidatus Solibacter sp.]
MEKRVSLAIVALVVVAQAIVIAPELTIASYRNTDAVSHYALIHGMVDAAEHGGNPLDFWSAETSLGVPLARLYQPFAHVMVAALYFCLGKSVALWTLFLWAKYVSVVVLPVSFYIAARWLDLDRATAAAVALLMPLIAGPGTGQLGIDLRSWLGFGLYPQAVGASLLLLSLGLSYRALRTGKYVAAAGALIGLTLLAHLIYGWMSALTACIVAVMPGIEIPRLVRIRRTVVMGLVAALVAAFQLVPLVTDGYLINRARSEPAEKYDSFGAQKVLGWLFSGQILDHDHLPVLTLLAFAGAGVLLWRWKSTRKIEHAHLFVLIAGAFWLLVFFGRPTWGVLLTLIGVTPDLHLHRVVGAVQIFLVFLSALGLAFVWQEMKRRWHYAAAVVFTIVILAPLAIERVQWVDRHTDLERPTYAAVQRDGPLLDGVMAAARQRGGRVFAGLRDTWGPRFTLGITPVYAFLTINLVPTITDAYNQTALPSDVIQKFNQTRAIEYEVLNLKTVVTPLVTGAPAFLKPAGDFGPFRTFEAPGTGYFGLVNVAAAADTTRDNFFDLANPWLHSDWPEKQQYIWMDFHGEAPRDLPRVTPGMLPAASSAGDLGTARNEKQNGQLYESDLDVSRPAWAVFRMTYHPAWKVTVDGQPAHTAMLTPGILGTPVAAGKHHIVCRYDPGNMKWVLL